MTVYIDDSVDHFYYGRGKVVEVFRYSNEAKVRFDKEVDGMFYHTVNITSLYRN
jgi:hypothetical protein